MSTRRKKAKGRLYSYPRRILDIEDKARRQREMREWVKVYKRERTLQRIRNLGRVPICPICQEPVLKKHRAAKQVVFCEQDSRHQCHYECWKSWAEITYAETTCPTCRHPYTNLNLKMLAMQSAGPQENVGIARVDCQHNSLLDDETHDVGIIFPYCYYYVTYTVELTTTENFKPFTSWDEWELADFDEMFFTLYAMTLMGETPSFEDVMSGKDFQDFHKLMQYARARKNAFVQLGMRERWVNRMLDSTYKALRHNINDPSDTSLMMREDMIDRNIAPFNEIRFMPLNCLPERTLRQVPALRVVQVSGTMLNEDDAPRHFVFSTSSGAPFVYDVDEFSNRVVLRAEDPVCATADNKELMSRVETFKIDMGRNDDMFRSTEQLGAFSLGMRSEGYLELSLPVVPRTIVTLEFEDGSKQHFVQNVTLPDSETEDDTTSEEDSGDY